MNTLSWIRPCSYVRRTDPSVSQKVGGRQRIGQQRLLGKSRCLQYVRYERKRLCGRHIPYAVNAYRGGYMMRYSWAVQKERTDEQKVNKMVNLKFYFSLSFALITFGLVLSFAQYLIIRMFLRLVQSKARRVLIWHICFTT